ncbi:formin-like protein 16 [Dorcoceras hygrometricum]|uniref:Formin-like protein 16 n=1 Tax=Dorcoceras hygrometricum TaxID=472368 RepID=A0A2Z7AP97_9LAMI|nr:formin-like protein 16 [Dorcoceras hygrometricum]
MASALITNTVQVFFDSVLGMDHEGMVSLFEALLATGLSGFLGCSLAIFEAALVELFHNSSVRDGMVVTTVQGKPVAILEELFVGTFELPLEGLTNVHEVPEDHVLEARCAFSYDGYGDSSDEESQRIHDANLCSVEKCPSFGTGESKEFPPLKILTAKTVGTYIAKNQLSAVNESWVIQEGNDLWQRLPKPIDSLELELPPQRQFDDTLSLIRALLFLGPLLQILQLLTVFLSINWIQISFLRIPVLLILVYSSLLMTFLWMTRQLLTRSCCLPLLLLRAILESLAQLRTSVSQLSIKHMRTEISIGDLRNHLLSNIDHLDEAFAEAHSLNDQAIRGVIKSVHQDVKTQKAALSLELFEFKKGVRAHSAIVTIDLADIHKDVKDQKAELSKEFDDRLDAIRNDLIEFHVEAQEQFATLRDNLAELIAFITRGRDDKKGEVSSSQSQGPPPTDDRSRPGDRGGV